jgi:type VI secretion system protein ImpH
MLQPIFALVKYMVGIEFEFDVRIILQSNEIQPCVLGKCGPDAPQLGWTTSLQSPGFDNLQNPSLTFAEKDLLAAH